MKDKSVVNGGLYKKDFATQIIDFQSELNNGYRGIKKVTREGEDALVELRYLVPRNGKLYLDIYTARMKPVSSHWRVVDFIRTATSLIQPIP